VPFRAVPVTATATATATANVWSRRSVLGQHARMATQCGGQTRGPGRQEVSAGAQNVGMVSEQRQRCRWTRCTWHGGPGTKIQRICVASEPSVAAEEPGEGYMFGIGEIRVVDDDDCRWNGGHGIPPELMGLGGQGDRAPDG
jgi:hypothetical protein